MESSTRNHIMKRNDKVDTRDGLSQWQRKYGTKIGASEQDHLVEDEDKSIIDWIAPVRDNAEINTAVSKVGIEHLIIPNNSPVDKDAEDIILRMNKLFDGISTTNDIKFKDNSYFSAFEDTAHFDIKSFGKDLLASDFQCEPLIDRFASSEKNKETFSGENMAILFRRTYDDKIARKCINHLLSFARDNRVVRGRVLSQWKKLVRDDKESNDAHVRRFRRRARLRIMRRFFSTWVEANRDGKVRLQKATKMYCSRAKSSVLVSWRRLLQQRNTRRSNRINSFRERQVTKQKREFLFAWLAVTGMRELLIPFECYTDQENTSSSAIATNDRATSMETNANLIQDGKEREIVQPMVSIGNNKENRSNHKQMDSRPRKRLQRTSTPKLIVEMNKRKQDREKSRVILRQRYEQQAIEKQKHLLDEHRKKEEESMKVQREFFERRAAEEYKKKLVASQRKQACCLAAMHRRMSLQKRMLHQWRKIFQINSFNQRKALIAWSDTTYEKCWKSWLLFMKKRQIERNEYILMRQQLADDFNERRLLASSFAALELQRCYTRSRLATGLKKVSAARQRCTLRNWHHTMMEIRKVRCSKEEQTKRNGTRFRLMRAMQYWRSGAKESREEREINILIEAKRREVNKWLEISHYY